MKFEEAKTICKSHLIKANYFMQNGEPFEANRELGSYIAVASIYYAETGDLSLNSGNYQCDSEIRELMQQLICTNWYGIPFYELDGDTALALVIERNTDEHYN